MTDKEIMRALRCTSTPGDHTSNCEQCPYWKKEQLNGQLEEKFGTDTYASCDIDKAGLDAADLIERLTAENVVLPDGQASVIESLRKEIEWKDMVIALAQKEQAKAEAERDALREKQRWIPVTERLPERDVQVLGWYKDNPFSQYRPEVVAWNGNGWVFVYAHRYVTNVTHWMPLPKAPEDGDT